MLRALVDCWCSRLGRVKDKQKVVARSYALSVGGSGVTQAVQRRETSQLAAALSPCGEVQPHGMVAGKNTDIPWCKLGRRASCSSRTLV
jgi:hypothetical protein